MSESTGTGHWGFILEKKIDHIELHTSDSLCLGWFCWWQSFWGWTYSKPILHPSSQFSQGPVSPEAPCEASVVREMVLEAQHKRFVWARMCLSVCKGFRGLGCEQKRDVFFLLCFSWKGHRGGGILPLQGLQLFPFSDLPEATFVNKEVGWGILARCDIWLVCPLVLSAPVRGVWLHWSWRRVECCLTRFVNYLGIASYRVQYPQWLLSSVWQTCARAFLLPCWSL